MAALVGALLIPVVAGGFFLQAREQREGALLLQQVMSLVSDRFVDTLPPADVYEKAAQGLVRQLNDPYSELLTPKDLKQINSRTNGRYGGLGTPPLDAPEVDRRIATGNALRLRPRENWRIPAECAVVLGAEPLAATDAYSGNGRAP